jgi:hypothetical protein
MSIAPIMSYGLKGIALTKPNRTQLRKYERVILQNMCASASDYDNQTTHAILEGKTITKRITAYRIRYWAHIQRRLTTTFSKSLRISNSNEEKVGRPCLTWNDSFQTDIERYIHINTIHNKQLT